MNLIVASFFLTKFIADMKGWEEKQVEYTAIIILTLFMFMLFIAKEDGK